MLTLCTMSPVASPSTSPFVIIGHRGNSALHPENTIQAFDAALESTYAFELDVQLTSDGVCIVLHDEQLGRTIPGSGPVAACVWDDLKDLDAGSWHAARDPAHASGCRVPTLREILERYRGRAHIHLVREAWRSVSTNSRSHSQDTHNAQELKSKQPGLERAVCSDLTKAGWLADLHQPPQQDPALATQWALQREPTGLTITSFHLESLERSMQVRRCFWRSWGFVRPEGASGD
jgi:hypothetical protein